jgi:hypothetical protein
MKRLWGLALACALIVLVALPAVASAQATRTWVSGVGDDVNPCSRTAPCKTFAGAISKTAAKGEINCIDPGGFGAVTITKAISIDCRHVQAGVLTNAASAINVSAGVNDVVWLRGLDVNGLDTAANGIKVNSGKRVNIQDTDIYGFATGGVNVTSSTANSKVVIQNSNIENIAGTGVTVVPTAANVRVVVRNSVVNGNGTGVSVNGTAQSVNASVFNSLIADNTGVGVFATGSLATVRIGGNEITGNGTGISATSFAPFGGIFSFGDNYINGNATDGTPQGTITPK